MTLTDVSLQIAATLLGGAIAIAFISALRIIAHRRYQGPDSEPYAGFQAGAHTETGEFLQLKCKGHCRRPTAHQVDDQEPADEDTATCVFCGTARPVPAPDWA